MNRFMPEKELQGKFKCTKDLYGILPPHFSDFGMEKLVQPLPLESLKKKKFSEVGSKLSESPLVALFN